MTGYLELTNIYISDLRAIISKKYSCCNLQH